jgi:hypothetical protein
MTESSVAVDVKSMTKTERRELRRIVARRFKMLRHQLDVREREVTRALRAKVRGERKAQVAQIERRMKPLIERQNKLAKSWEELYSEAAMLKVSIHLPGAAATINLDAQKARWGRDAVQADTGQEVDGMLDEIKAASGWSNLDLNEMEWRLDEELAIGELESGSAQKFLSALPTVETLLPLPPGVEMPAIEA